MTFVIWKWVSVVLMVCVCWIARVKFVVLMGVVVRAMIFVMVSVI